MRRYGDLQLLRRLMVEARPYWLHVGALFVLSLLAAPIMLLIPVPLKIAVDNVLGDHPPHWLLEAMLPESVVASKGSLLVVIVVMVIAIGLALQFQNMATSVLWAYTGESLILRFRARLFGHVQRLSMGFHDSKGGGDTLYRIQYDATAIEGVVISGIIPLVTAAVTLLAMVLVTARIDGQLALVALAVSPVLIFLTQIYRRLLREQWSEAKRIQSSVLSIVKEALGMLRVVKAFGGERHEEGRFSRRAYEGIRAQMRAILSQHTFNLLLGLTIAVGTAAALYVGVRHVQTGTLTLGNLVLIMLYLAMLYQPLETIGMKVASVQNALAGAERAYTLMEETPEVVESPRARPLSRGTGSVAFQGVSFSYPDRDGHPVADVSFDVPAGSRVGISGETGAGKTTLVSLLPRFYDPTAGRILLDGVDLREYRLADLRNQFAIVLQDPVLFSGSIVENISYSRPGAEMSEILRAAKDANAHGFIERLPEKYDTLVGERGMLFSGGQRQLISIARAFLRDAPILILDEPTSSVDIATEGVVLEAMRRLMEGRTTFLISHRPGTLEMCDLLLVMHRGRVVEIQSRSHSEGRIV